MKINLKEYKENLINEKYQIVNLTRHQYYWLNFIKDFYDKYENWNYELDISDAKMISHNVWYININIHNSWKEWMNYYRLKEKDIFIEPKCFNNIKDFSLETVWLILHETLHCYFTKWENQEKFIEFIFDENKPMFSQIHNIFEDIRINNLSEKFYYRWQDYIKLIYINAFNKTKIHEVKSQKLKIELANYSVIQWTLSIWDQRLNHFLKTSIAKRDEIREMFPEETKLIDNFIEDIINHHYDSKNFNDLRKDWDRFAIEVFEKMYPLIIDQNEEKEKQEEMKKKLEDLKNQMEKNKEDNQQKEQWNNWEDNEKRNKWWEQESDWKQWNNGKSTMEEILDTFWEMSPFNWEESKENQELWNKENKDSWKEWDSIHDWIKSEKSSSWGNLFNWKLRSKEVIKEKIINDSTYDKIVLENKIVISNLKSKFLQTLEKRRTSIKTWFNNWKTISSRVLMSNILKSKSWEIRKNEILNWTFKKLENNSKKILNVISICIDKSWSMHWENIELSKKASVIVVEALKNIDTQITVNSFDQENHTIYDWWYNNDYKKITWITADWWTSEINTLMEVEKQFKKLKSKFEKKYHEINWISILITDWFWDDNAKIEVDKLRKENIYSIWIWISTNDYEKNEIEENLLNTYWEWNYFILDDVKNLPVLLPKIVVNQLK